MEDIYYGSLEDIKFELQNEDGSLYVLPEQFKLIATFKKDLKPTSELLFNEDISSDFTINLRYVDYSKMKIGQTYYCELVLVDKETGEYLPPIFQETFTLQGVAYGREDNNNN